MASGRGPKRSKTPRKPRPKHEETLGGKRNIKSKVKFPWACDKMPGKAKGDGSFVPPEYLVVDPRGIPLDLRSDEDNQRIANLDNRRRQLDAYQAKVDRKASLIQRLSRVGS